MEVGLPDGSRTGQVEVTAYARKWFSLCSRTPSGYYDIIKFGSPSRGFLLLLDCLRLRPLGGRFCTLLALGAQCIGLLSGAGSTIVLDLSVERINHAVFIIDKKQGIAVHNKAISVFGEVVFTPRCAS